MCRPPDSSESTSSRGAAGGAPDRASSRRPTSGSRSGRAASETDVTSSVRPSSARAAGLQTVIWPPASSAMTPVVTDSSTVEKRRRSSSSRRLESWSSAFVWRSAPRASSSPAAMRLKDSTRTASSSVAGTSTRAEKSPERSRPVEAASAPIGSVMRFASVRPVQIDAKRIASVRRRKVEMFAALIAGFCTSSF